jgi:hypothetical protein
VKRLKSLWMPALLGVLLMTSLVGAAVARPNARPLEQAWRVLSIPALVCIPHDEGDDYRFLGTHLYCQAPDCDFACEIDFPAAGEQAVGAISVKRVTMYAYDNAVGLVQFSLLKTYAPMGVSQQMAWAMTSDLANDPQAAMDTSVVNNPVYRTQAPVLWLSVGNTTGKVYGFHVHYTWL